MNFFWLSEVKHSRIGFATIALEGRVTENQCKVVLSDLFYPMMKHFYADGNDLFNKNASIHKAHGFTKFFEKYAHDVSQRRRPLQSAELKPAMLPTIITKSTSDEFISLFF